jgi:AmmeMemoRadiSam system protein B
MNYTITTVLPRLRSDIAMMKHVHMKEEYLLIYDPLRYSHAPVILGLSGLQLIDKLGRDDQQTCVEISNTTYNGEINPHDILDVVMQLSERCFLLDEVYFKRKEEVDKAFREADIREPFCLGTVYPETKHSAISMLDEIKELTEKRESASLTGIIIPHVELSEGTHAYSSAIRALEANPKPDLVIMFGTSHYGGEGRFIMTEKDYSTPLGRTKTNTDLVNVIYASSKQTLTRNDEQHRYDHSIEMVLLLLQYVYGAEQFSLLPVLVNTMHDRFSFPDHINDEGIDDFLSIIHDYVKESNQRVLFVSSGDLSHIGRKFGDAEEAHSLVTDITMHDSDVIASMCAHDAEGFFKKIANTHDHSRICGCAPNYLLMKSIQSKSAELLAYQWWDQPDTSSAVSFCSIGYFDVNS